MSNLDKFMERGADCVAGSIILRGKTMGNLRNGDLVLTEDGMAELEVDEVVDLRAPAAPAAKTARAPKVPKAPKVETPPAQVDADPLDLGDLDLE